MNAGQAKETFTFGTWNVRGLKEKRTETFAEIQRENVDIVVLTETKLKGVGEEDYGFYIHLHSGIVSGVPRAGISLLVRRELRKLLKWEAVTERLVKATIKICGRKITIIGVYWVDDTARSAAKDIFQNKLKTVLDSCRKTDELIILGDFNARVGTETASLVVGPFGESEVNDNGKRLKKLCEQYGLKIQNTFFDHEDRHKYTWYRSRPPNRTLIDHCITKQNTSLPVKDVVACRWLDCGTDHIFLKATVSFSNENVDETLERQDKCLEMRKYRTYLLFSEEFQTLYKEFLEDKISLKITESVHSMYNHLKQCIHDAAFHVLGIVDESVCGEFLWDDELRRLNATTKEPNSAKNLLLKLEAAGLDLKKVKNEVWEGICRDISGTSKIKRLCKAQSILDEFHNTCSQNKGSTQSEDKSCGIILKESRLSNIEFVPASGKSLDQNSTGFNEVKVSEVSNALEELDETGFPSPGGIPLKFLRYGGTKTNQLLTDLIQKIFNGSEIPTEITETYLTPSSSITDKRAFSIKNVKHSLHSVMRVMGAILKHRLNNCATVEEEGYLEVIFVLRQLMQKYADLQNDPLHIAVVDYERLYNDIQLKHLFDVLDKRVDNKKVIDVIKKLYGKNTYRVVMPNIFSKTYFATDGLRLGCSLSPRLFAVYVQDLIKEWKQKNGVIHSGITMQSQELHSLVFNDSHLIIVSDNKQHFCEMIKDLKRRMRKIHLNMHFIYLGREDLELEPRHRAIKAEDSIYLQNFILEFDGRNVEEVLGRTWETKQVIGLLHSVARDEMITVKNKKKIFNSIIKCFLTFGCETWTMTVDLRKVLEAVEVSYWKWCREEYPLVFTKKEIYDRMKVTSPVCELIMVKKTAWYTTILQMDSTKVTNFILNWTPKGKRRTGFPRKKWVNGLEDFLRTCQPEGALEGDLV